MSFPHILTKECEICFKEHNCVRCNNCHKYFCTECYIIGNIFDNTKVFSCPDCKNKLSKIYQYLILGRDCTKYVEFQIEKYKEIIGINKHYDHDFTLEFQKLYPEQFSWIQQNKDIFLSKVGCLKINNSSTYFSYLFTSKYLLQEIAENNNLKNVWNSIINEDINDFINGSRKYTELELFVIINEMFINNPELLLFNKFRLRYFQLNYKLFNEGFDVKLHDDIEYFLNLVNSNTVVNIRHYKILYESFKYVFADNELNILLMKSILHIDNNDEILHTWLPKILNSYRLNNGKVTELKPELKYCEIRDLIDKTKRKSDITRLLKIKKYSMACPNPLCVDGYMVDNNGELECNKCKNKYCIKCRQLLCDDHKCKQEDLDTLKCIRENSRECPCCGTIIQRSRGCNHMFCTVCHTGFCYKTGRILKDSEQTNTLFTEWKQSLGKNDVTQDDKMTLNQLILYADSRSYYRSYYEQSIAELSKLYRQFESKKLEMVRVFCDNQEKILHSYENPIEIINLFHHINLSNILFKYLIYSFNDFIQSKGNNKYYKKYMGRIYETISIIEKLVGICLL